MARETYDTKIFGMFKKTLEKAYGELDPTDLEELRRYCGIMQDIKEANARLKGKEIEGGKLNPLISLIEKKERLADVLSRKLGLHLSYRYTTLKAKMMATGGGDNDDDDDAYDDKDVDLP